MNGPGPVRRHVAVEMRVQTRTEKEDETRRTLRRFSSRGCDRGGQPSAPPGAGVSVSSDRRHRSAPGSDPSTNHATKCRALRVVAGEPAADLDVVARLRDRLDPEVGDQPALVSRLQVGVPHSRNPERRVGLGLDRGLPHCTARLPGVLEAREVEIALGREVAVEDRLGHAGLARDLRRRRPAVAAFREDPGGAVEDRGAALFGGQPRFRGAHATSASASVCSASTGSCRTRTKEPLAPTTAIPAATQSDVEKPSTKRSGFRKTCGPRRPPTSWAMIAPIRAIPTEPPTCRNALSTAEPTPDLSTGSARTAAAALGVITSAMPIPPRISPGKRSRYVECWSWREKYTS